MPRRFSTSFFRKIRFSIIIGQLRLHRETFRDLGGRCPGEYARGYAAPSRGDRGLAPRLVTDAGKPLRKRGQ
jgi:hypothetical protein